MKPRRYESPAAFKQALEQRLRGSATGGVDVARRRQLLVFERFLARIFHAMDETAILKGGLVLELRLERARTTKDVDLRLSCSPEDILENLRRAGRLDLGDFLMFEVRPDPQMRFEGLRYRAEAHRLRTRSGEPLKHALDPLDHPWS